MMLQPPSALLIGAPGSGKTYAQTTWLEAGLKLFVISTEPDGINSLLDACRSKRIPITNLHWASCLPSTPGWMSLDEMAMTIGTMGFEKIQNIKEGVGKQHTRAPAMKILNQFKNFQCERTGEAFGPVDKFGPDSVLVIDSLSGLSLISWMLTIGHKPAAHQGEWGVSMNFIEQLLLKVSSDRNCYFCLTAHIERETNDLTGATQIMASTLGRKLAPKIPRFFSEVILARRTIKPGAVNQANFLWSTVDANADLKNRSLPLGSELQPTFAPLITSYKERLKQIEAQDVTASQPQKETPKPQTLTPPQLQRIPQTTK